MVVGLVCLRCVGFTVDWGDGFGGGLVGCRVSLSGTGLGYSLYLDDWGRFKRV